MIGRHGCALAGSDNLRVIDPASSRQQELQEYETLSLSKTREDRVAMMEARLTTYAPFHCRPHHNPSLSIHPSRFSFTFMFSPPPYTIIEMDEVHVIAGGRSSSTEGIQSMWVSVGLSHPEHRDRYLNATNRVDVGAQWQFCVV